MDFQSAMETFAEAWVAANTKGPPISDVSTQGQALALTRNCKSPPLATTPATTGRCSRDSAERPVTPPPATTSTPLDISPSLVKEEFDPTKATPAKSLPVHCVVEAVCSLDENRSLQHGVWRRRPMVETDSYVIIPVGTPFHNLVQAALLRLGYSADSAAAARGSVLIKNWKPLNFDQITDDPLVTVGDILGELSTIATLKIQVFRGRPGILGDIKDKLLKFMLVQSHGLLLSSGCPLDEIILSQICRNNSFGSNQIPEITDELRRKFDQWWGTQFTSQSPSVRSQYSTSFPVQYAVPPQTVKPLERTMSEPSHPALQTVHSQFPTQKTRMRTSFDPELELPKLQRWFTENQHPSRQQIQQYVKELNGLESRRGRKPLDVNNVVYWFKNARAAQKRAEIRNVAPGLPCHLSLNGYSNHSPTNGSFLLADGYLNSERLIEHRLKHNLTPRRGAQTSHTSDEYSNNGSDLEEEDITDVQPSSPSVPLSLTTTRKQISRNSSPHRSSPVSNIQADICKEEPKEEPLNYSPVDHINNNKIHLSDMEEDAETQSEKCHFQGSNRGSPPPISRTPQRFCNSPDIDSHLVPRVSNDGLDRLAAGFPMVPNSMFSHSIMYMSHYIPSLTHAASSPPGSSSLGISALTADERRKRNRTFIDPVTEVPRLEQWFSQNTHPSHNLILKYTEELNCMAYRQKFPRLEPKNVQFWFKNRRAKCKRLKMSLFDNQNIGHYHHNERD